MSYHIFIFCQTQRLELYKSNKLIFSTVISTGANGIGQQNGSGKTPLGWHQVFEKYGDNACENTVFRGRKATGEIYDSALKLKMPNRDWILTRILRLKGLEPGFNLGGEVDTYQRYIYLHGTPDDTILGKPGSKGCIRMNNKDIIYLYDLIAIGTPVYVSL